MFTCQVRAASAAWGPHVWGLPFSCQASARPVAYISKDPPACFYLPGHTARSQIGSNQIYGYLLDVFEIHRSFRHRKLDLPTIFCEALLALIPHSMSPSHQTLPTAVKMKAWVLCLLTARTAGLPRQQRAHSVKDSKTVPS